MVRWLIFVACVGCAAPAPESSGEADAGPVTMCHVGLGTPASPSTDSQAPPLLALTTVQGWHVDVSTQPQPPVRGDNTVEYRFLDGNRQPVVGVALTVRPWMPAHGHGSSITPTVEEVGNGVYRATHVYLFMDSTWELQATVTEPSQDAFTVTCEVHG